MRRLLDLTAYMALLVACGGNAPDEPDVAVFENETSYEIRHIENDVNKGREPTLQPIKKKYSQDELRGRLFVYDSTQNRIDNLVGRVMEWTTQFPIMFVDTTYNGRIRWTADLYDTIRIIPFRLDLETTIVFTKWRIFEDSSLAYEGVIYPFRRMKYTVDEILQVLRIDEKIFLIGKAKGGDGGDHWETLWTAEYNGKDSMTIEEHCFVTFQQEVEPVREIEYNVDGNEVDIFVLSYSLINEAGQDPINREKMKTLILN